MNQPGDLSVCQCCNIHFNWNYDKPPNVDTRGITWQHIVGTHSDTQIMVKEGERGSAEPMGVYRNRVEFVPNAGMKLNNLVKEDAGDYRCTVVLSDKSHLTSTASLKVTCKSAFII